MKYKLIALDLDGTLLNDEKIITEGNEKALIQAQQSGVKVVISSGRMPYGVRKYAEQLKLKEYGGYCICFNGGLVVDADGKVLFRKYMDRKYLKEICDIAEDTDVTVIVHKKDGLCGNENRNEFTDVAPKTVNAPLTQIENLYEYANWDFHKILLVGEYEKLCQLKEIICQRFQSELEVCFSTPWFLEVMPQGVDKGEALKNLCETIGFAVEETIACGDNFNDRNMLETAGLSVVMANGEDELKKKADYITVKDCNNDGIAEVVEKFIREKV